MHASFKTLLHPVTFSTFLQVESILPHTAKGSGSTAKKVSATVFTASLHNKLFGFLSHQGSGVLIFDGCIQNIKLNV